jgi:hypothetical protein
MPQYYCPLICGSVILCRHVALFWRIYTEDVSSRIVRNVCVCIILVHTAEVRNFVTSVRVSRNFSRCYGNYMRKGGKKGRAVHNGGVGNVNRLSCRKL